MLEKNNNINNKSQTQEKKAKHIFNLFDIIFVVFILLILLFFGFKIKKQTNSGLTKEIYFTIEALKLDKDFKNKISIGDQIRDSVKGYFYGEVSDFKSKPATKITEDTKTGKFILTKIPNKIDLEITVKCDAKISDDLITVDNNPVRLGKLMSLKSKGYVIYGYMIDLKTE